MKKILAIILSISMTLGSFVNPVLASESDLISDSTVSAESSQLEVRGEDSADQMIADAITEQAAEQNPDSSCYISSLTIDRKNMTAEIRFSTDEDAELMVSIFSENRTGLYASGRQKVTPAEHNATIQISYREAVSSLPDTFIGEAYLLDQDSHAPLCDSFTTNEYTKEITDLKKSTIEDFQADRVLNLDADTKTNFAVYNDEINVIEEKNGKNQITDNGDGTYTVRNADASFTSLKSGDKLSYTDSDGRVLLLTVAKITVNGNTVTIQKETKEEDLTDYFDYLKIETTDQNVPLDIDESTMGEGVSFLGCDLETQGETAVVGASGEGSLSHSLSFQIKEKLISSEDQTKTLEINAELKLQLKTTLKYYLSGDYQKLSLKIEYSTSVSAGVTGKLDKKYPLVRVEMAVLPGINVGFTPSFVIKVTGEAKWTGEWKGAIGFAYDTENGDDDPGEAPTTSSKVEISATLFIGVEATPYVSIVDKNLCKASLEASAGIELKGTQSEDSDKTKIHKCEDCIAGSVKCKFSEKVKLEVIKSTATIEATLVSLEAKLFDFYYSFTYNEFGYDTCPHVYYKTKVSLTDKNGQAVSEGRITPMKVSDAGPTAVKFLTDKDNPEITSVVGDTDGTSVIYLPKGKYVFYAKTDELAGETKAEIKKKSNYTNEVKMTMGTRTYPVMVTVQDENENPISGASFAEKNQETGKTISINGKTDANGQAEIQLTLGTHFLETKTDTEKGSGEITVTAKENNALTITVAKIKYGTINLTAVDGEGNAVSGASISGANLSPFLVTDSNGKSSFKAEVGPLTIHVKKDKAAGDAELEVKEGEQDVTVVLANLPTLTVYVVDENGKPIENAVISGLNNEIEPRTDTNGIAQMTIPKGEYCIQVYTDTMFNYKDITIKNLYEEKTITLKNSQFFWTLNEGELRIFGNGDMPYYADSSIYSKPWLHYLIKSVMIEDGITSIASYAFYNMVTLESVTIADTVKKVGERAFWGCSSLESIVIPNGVTTISACAFRGCSRLKSIILSDTIKEIGWYAFENCSSLESIVIPNGVTTIGRQAFCGCSSLKSIVWPNTVTTIAKHTFYDCSNLENVLLPDSVTTIEDYAFKDCIELESIKLPTELTTICDDAFNGCSSLKSIVIPDGVTTVGSYAFEDCINLESITLPDGIIKINNYTFNRCSKLKSITIPDTVEIIGYDAFKECISLESIKLSAELKDMYEYAFSGCSSLESITLPNGVRDIDRYVFSGCSSLKSITWSNIINWIGGYAFNGCTSLKSIMLPNTVESIDERAFSKCSSLENIFIPDSVTVCGSCIFDGCTSLKTISIPETMETNDDTFSGCNATIIRRTSTSSTGDAFSDSIEPSTDDESVEISSGEVSSENEEPSEVIFDDEYIEDDTESNASDNVDIAQETEEVDQPDTADEFGDGAEPSEEVTTVLEKNITEAQSRGTVSLWNEHLETNLVPGEKYLLVYVCRKNEEDLLNAKNIYYMQQETADTDGTIQFKYPKMIFEVTYPDSIVTDPEVFIYGPATENNLADAEVQIASRTESADWQSPEIQVSYKGKVLTEDTDYHVYGDTYIKEAGEYSVLIKGIGDYNGRIRVGYTVEANKNPSEPDKPTPSEPEQPTDHTHKYSVSYKWEKVSNGQMKCTIVWDCTEENCGEEAVTEATVNRTGSACTGFTYKASGVLDGVNYTDTYKEAGTGHSWTSWRVVSTATVTQPEKQTRRCQKCGITENRNNGSALRPTIQVNASSFPMKVKQATTKLKVAGLAAGDRVLSWSSSNPKILTVNKDGKLKAGKKTGKVTVTIKLASGLTKQIKITVQKKTVKTTKISLPQTKIVLKKGKKQTLKPIITPITSMQKITFSSSNKKVVSVNSKGLITARKKGKAKITIRSGSKKKVVTVTVK